MKSKIDKEFYLSRGEYAKRLGKSKGSIIQLMRRGKLNNEYIVNNGQCLRWKGLKSQGSFVHPHPSTQA